MSARATAATGPARRSNGWWGMALVIVTELALFGVVVASYYYLSLSNDDAWPPAGVADPKLARALGMTAAIVVAGVAALLAMRTAGRGRRAAPWLVVTALGAIGFLVLQGLEFAAVADVMRPQDGAYESLFFTIAGLHAAHVLVGLVLAIWALAGLMLSRFGSVRAETVRIVGLFWVFMVAIWAVVLFTLYLTPRL